MVTREFLLNNGFKFRTWEGAESKDEGEYTKRIDDNKFIAVGYSNLYKWNYDIRNTETFVRLSADCQDVIYIDQLRDLIAFANINFYLKRPDDILFSDFRRSVDFTVLFDFGDNDYSTRMAAAAEFYCDAFNDLLSKIDSHEMKNIYIDDFNKLCQLENVKEIMKCGLVADMIKSYSTDFGDNHPDVNEIIGRSMKSLDYIFGNDKKKRWGKVDGKYVITEEMDRFVTGTHEEILTLLSKHGEPYEKTTSDDMFPVWCNGEVVILYMKDGFLTYTIL